MAYIFTDGFDCYAAPADAINGYWDSGAVSFTLVAGRFSGSQGIQQSSASGVTANLVKSSGANDGLHHISVAFQQTVSLGAANNYVWLTLSDGATAQCSVVFRLDGSIILASGASSGTILATYSGAVTAPNVWYQFEIEVNVSSTGGYMNVRKNGNTVNDFASATNLNTRAGTTNNYANRLSVGSATSGSQQIDDLMWRSDASSLAWLGDIRCITRRPASDVAVAWSRSGSVVPVTPQLTTNTTNTLSNSTGKYLPFTAPCNGTLGSVTMQVTAAITANIKMSLFASSATPAPTTVISSATTVTNPGVGPVTFTFPTPPTLVAGTQYYIGFIGDAASGSLAAASTSVNPNYLPLQVSSQTYAAFPAANPTPTAAGTALGFTANVTPTGSANFAYTSEQLEDGAASYNYSSTVSQSDLYGIGATSVTPASVVATTLRAYAQKSDAGTKIINLQLKSGGTTVQSSNIVLNTTFGWGYRTDTTDPATGSAWTPTAVNNAQIGMVVNT